MSGINSLHKALFQARSLAQARLHAGAMAVRGIHPGFDDGDGKPQSTLRSARVRRLSRVLFRHEGAVLVAESYTDGVLRVKGIKSGLVLAVSEPGQHAVLSVSFEPLTPSDLAPQVR